MTMQILVQYNTISEADRFNCTLDATPSRNEKVIVETDRGLQLGIVLSPVPLSETPTQFSVLRKATPEDIHTFEKHRNACETEYHEWTQRIIDWNLDLELIDMEWTLDHSRLTLYVLSDRGPDCTKLALQAAAAGLGIIEVQPVNAEGLAPIASSGGGCGCSSGGGGCSKKKK